MADVSSSESKSVGLLVKLGYQGIGEFIQAYATHISREGMFIRTRDAMRVGTRLSFKVELAQGQRVFQGEAVVKWTRPVKHPDGPPGMALQFVKLDDASRGLLEQLLCATAPPPPTVQSVAPPRPSRPAAPSAAPPTSSPPRPPGPSAASDARHEIDLALESLLATTPQPPPAPSSPSGFDIDIAPAPPRPLDVALAPPSAPPRHPAQAFTPPPPVPPLEEPMLLLKPKAKPPAPSAPAAPAPAAPAPPPPVAPVRAAPAAAVPVLAPAAPSAPPPVAPVRAVPAAGAPVLTPTAPTAPAPPAAAPLPGPPQAPVAQAPAAVAAAAALSHAVRPVFLKEPEPADTGPIIGIDLGTTNSACAVLSKRKPTILSSTEGYNTIPSVVALSRQGRLLVGHRAKGQLLLNPEQSVAGAKRLVGRDFDSPTVKQVRARSHYEICAGDDGRPAVRLGTNVVSLEEIQGLVLRECREMAEQVLCQRVTRAVVTCPAYYSEPQRESVRRAGRLAGLKVERVLNEPTAAALAYGMSRQLEKTVLVYDLGGGTFDATLLRIEGNVFEVLATGGDVFLGGVDFDNQIVDLLLERYQRHHGAPFGGERAALSRLSDAAERAKIALSQSETYDVILPVLEMDASGTPRDLRTTLKRSDVEGACRGLVDRTLEVVDDVLLDADTKPSHVDDIILVGGMSRMPLVRDRLTKFFKKAPQASVNADEAVALGAALYSSVVDKVSSLVLIDVVPMTVGLGAPGGGFLRLIERNTPLPATKSFGVSTAKDGQEVLEILVFQGEDEQVLGNEFLAAVRIEGIPPGPRGTVQIGVNIQLDAECVLRAEAHELKTRQPLRTTTATRYAHEQIVKLLKIAPEQQRSALVQKRSAELEQRAGGFWSRIKSAFSGR